MIPLALLILLLSILIGYAGRNRKFGFWGYFFASLLFSPFMGILLFLASSSPEELKEDEVA